MSPRLFDREGPGADYETVHVVQDAASGLHALIALHSTRLGPAFGGIRRMRYESEDAALADVLNLASGMTWKCALAGLPAGGGKTVILDHAGLDRAAAYRALGRAIANLGGRYVCGPDVGTGDAELAEVRAETRWVNPPGNDAGASTAAGVLAGLRGLLTALDGDAAFAGKTFLVQGLGSVGLAVARGLREGGATVLGSDVNADAVARARALGVEPVAPEAATTTPCDVFVPCALGGVLTRAVAEKLPARAVCGSANNQLADADAGRVLHERAVLYAPDFVVNAGAVIEGVITIHEGATDAARAKARDLIAHIEDTVEDVLTEALDAGMPPHDVALGMARHRVAAGQNQ